MITSDHILHAVAAYFCCSVADLRRRSRNFVTVYRRNFAMLMLREFAPTISSYKQIAGALDYGDHASAVHGIRQITNLIDTDEVVRRDAERLRQHIQSLM